MHKIQNIRKPSNSYLKTEFGSCTSIKDLRFTTDPSPNKGNKENVVKPSYLKATLQNHLIKQEKNITPNINKSNVVSLFLRQEQTNEIKGNICQIHRKKQKYEINFQQMCSRCVIDYAIQQGIQIRFNEGERKMLTFGQDEEQDDMQQFTQSVFKELQYINNITTTQEGIIKKKELRDFIVKVGDVISQNMQFLRTIQQQQLSDNPKQQICKILDELQQIGKQVINEYFEKQQSKSQNNIFEENNQITLNGFKQIIQQQIQDLSNIKKDIMENIDNIISQMDVAPFKIIINKYNDKLKVFENTLQDIQDQYKQTSTQTNDNQIYFKKMRDPKFKKKLSSIFVEVLENNEKKQTQFCDQNISHNNLVNNNTKFIQLLQKVNTNQNTNTIFYQSILKDIHSDEKPKQLKQTTSNKDIQKSQRIFQ